MTGLWGGRFEGGLNPAFESFNRSLPFDQRLWREDIEGSRAWARALAQAGVLTSVECDELCTALTNIADELTDSPQLLAESNAEDIHTFVEVALTSQVGDLARKLHTGRSRNDQVATDMRLYAKRQCAALVQYGQHPLHYGRAEY